MAFTLFPIQSGDFITEGHFDELLAATAERIDFSVDLSTIDNLDDFETNQQSTNRLPPNNADSYKYFVYEETLGVILRRINSSVTEYWNTSEEEPYTTTTFYDELGFDIEDYIDTEQYKSDFIKRSVLNYCYEAIKLLEFKYGLVSFPSSNRRGYAGTSSEVDFNDSRNAAINNMTSSSWSQVGTNSRQLYNRVTFSGGNYEFTCNYKYRISNAINLSTATKTFSLKSVQCDLDASISGDIDFSSLQTKVYVTTDNALSAEPGGTLLGSHTLINGETISSSSTHGSISDSLDNYFYIKVEPQVLGAWFINSSEIPPPDKEGDARVDPSNFYYVLEPDWEYI